MFQHSWIHVITVMHVSANTMDLIYYKKPFLTNDLYLSRQQIVMQIYPCVTRKTLQKSFNFVQRSESESETQEKMIIFLSVPNSQEGHFEKSLLEGIIDRSRATSCYCCYLFREMLILLNAVVLVH